MEELNQKLDKDTFNRFKLIQHLIKKYPIIKYDISRIEQIKNSYKFLLTPTPLPKYVYTRL